MDISNKNSLCWKCKKATNSNLCKWVDDYTPIEVWIAKRRDILSHNGKQIESYIVYECPNFERG